MTAPEHDPAVDEWAAVLDARTWGVTAGVRRGEMAALERQAFPPCPNSACGPLHKWHGLACKSGSCRCETSWSEAG